MPNKVPGSRNFRFNRSFKKLGVGRITNSAETALLTEYRYRDGLLTKLAKAGMSDTLRAFKYGHLKLGDLISADHDGTLYNVADRVRLARPLGAALDEWLPKSAAAAGSRRRYKVSRDHWCAKDPVVFTRPVSVLENYNWDWLVQQWGASGADWNRFRAMLSAFLTDFCGHVHAPFRLKVMGKMKRMTESAGVVPSLTPQQFWAVVEEADASASYIFVAMAALAVGYKELTMTRLGAPGVALVRGTKNGRAFERPVSFARQFSSWVTTALGGVLLPYWPEKALRKEWNRACAKVGVTNVRLYDLRHFHAQLAADAGVPERDIAQQLGHQNVQTTRRYTRRQSTERVAEAVADALLPAQVHAQATGLEAVGVGE